VGIESFAVTTLKTNIRLAELMASLSLAMDLGIGKSMEWVLNSCLLGVRFAERLGLSERECREVYYLSLLRHIGCTATASEEAELYGNELNMHAALTVDAKDMAQAMGFLLRVPGQGQPLLQRARFVARALAAGPAAADAVSYTYCDVATRMATTLGVESSICEALWQVYERYDGRGIPKQLKGEQIVLPVRVVQLAQDAVTVYQIGGTQAAQVFVRERAGKMLDPGLVEKFNVYAPELLGSLNPETCWTDVLAAEPGAPEMLAGERFEQGLLAIADFTDLKSPFTCTHSRQVAALAAQAAQAYGLPTSDADLLGHVGLVHELGRVGITSAIWDKPGPLTESEWERVRLHPYLTERILSKSPTLAVLGALASMHHERLDGSGYHRQLPAAAQTATARVFAAANAYHALTELRPYRAACAPEAAADELRRQTKAGKFEAKATDAVLAAAGHRIERRRVPALDLSDREIEVLRLIARGMSNKHMAAALIISPKTVGHHIQHIYNKLGVSTRAGATLFAMQNGLLE